MPQVTAAQELQIKAQKRLAFSERLWEIGDIVDVLEAWQRVRVGHVLYQPAETLTRARMLRVRARLPYPIGPPDVIAMAVSLVARAA